MLGSPLASGGSTKCRAGWGVRSDMFQPKRIGIKPLRPKPSQVLEITNVQPNPQFAWQM